MFSNLYISFDLNFNQGFLFSVLCIDRFYGLDTSK